MAGTKIAAFAILPTRTAAEQVVNQLIAAGFSNNDVSVLMSDRQSSRDFATEKNTKAPEGTTAGASVGGIVGGTLGLLAGIGALAIPGIGPLVAAGPIMAALAGLGAGGAVDGLVGALIGLGIPEYEAKRYQGRVDDGGILVSVQCESSERITRAKDLLRVGGGEDVASTGEVSAPTQTASREIPVDRNLNSQPHPNLDRARSIGLGEGVVDADRDKSLVGTENTTTRSNY